ncbi:amino acid transporter [Mycolicibacterium phlei]|jgi:amino acid transporter|uniref:Amino acid transporter n=1 Tax=Mycolicibacterium phlei DSM 43239 = CCUG 21000 TaxID=1226750 RepID=A0A5N5V7Z2_MYCPH|nr:APC family permease [Mycolicibacterium phlei]VEG08448.1 amino acid transporter [Mycobacteroides chelonae]AMO60328.1 Putrescine importer PuuP [Mycolicibacterium phlei]EID17787.1 amino acid transporter [Mycolicibacterium phlei RIVM601174]KAB7756629.1 amino acid transporter [Mycolicibacterium phlei DSM 43239 = CCUG 21000]KXW62116.1 amino acid transporter [Mycolicibacterium phlei DSM 43070]
MAIQQPAVPAVGEKGLQAGALGLVGNIVIGLAATAPAYSLAATLGYVVLAVGEKAPSMFVVAFIPMLLVAFAYKELAEDTPDCGTTFTWGTKAFGPWVGWIGGWGLAVSAIIVLANVAEVSAIYLFEFLNLDDLADNLLAKVLLGSFFIVGMTLVSARGIVVSERLQNVLMAIQFGVLIVISAIALIRVFSGTAGAQAVSPQLSWLWPSGLDESSIAAAVILCIFIYWGWDACLAVGEETKNPGRTPGIAAVLTTLILVFTYVLVAYAVQSFSGFSDVGIGLNNPDNTDDVLTVLGKPVAGAIAASALLLTVSVSALSSTQTTILPTARGTLSMAVYEAIPKRFASVHPRYMTPAFGTIVMGLSALFFYLLLSLLSENALADSIASLGLAVAFYYGITAFACVWYFRSTLLSSVRNLFFRGIFPVLGGLAMTWAFFQSAIDMIQPDYGYTAFGPVGGVFVLGVGMLVLGVPLMLACFAFGTKRFFRGETLTPTTEVKVPDTY